jgi:hypothetical protein
MQYLLARPLHGMPRERISCLFHFAGLAATLAMARVLLNTIGATLFLSHEGPARLPLFYLVLAVVTVLLSFGLSRVIDRLPRVRLAQAVLGGCLLGAAALRWPVALDAPGVYFVLLASGHIYEIVLDIVLWVVIAGFTDSVELKRATPVIYMSLAIGGAAGGGAAHGLSALMAPADMLCVLPLLALVLVAQLALVERRLQEVPDDDPADRSPSATLDGATGLVGLVRRFPLSLLIALNALVMTILYGLSEYLVFTIYSARFPEERELARFLALVFALLQTIEFGLLYAVSWPLLERTGPLVRNLVFPLTSFASLIYLVASQKLPAALVLHVNAEAVSNAIYQPVSNANYIPLPLRFQGRARTLADGVFYPTGLALAGGMLVLVPEQNVMTVVGFIAIVFVLIFGLIGVGIGLLFLPTLRTNVGAGLLTPGQTVAVDPLPAPRVRTLLGSREPELRLLGLAMAQRLDPSALEDDLLALARRAERNTRSALARLVAAAPRPWALRFLDRCLAGSEQEGKLALVVLLIRHARPQPEQLARVLEAHDQAVVALGQLVAHGLGAWPYIEPRLQRPGVASDLVEAIVCAERFDLGLLLLAGLAAAEPEQQYRALVMLNSAADPPAGVARDALRLLARRGTAAVRAEALVLLSRTSDRAAAVRQLVAGLDDRDRHVRRRAAEALLAHGDRATALLRHRLAALTLGTADAVWTLARIAAPRSRRLLAAFVRVLQQDAERTDYLLERIAARPDRTRWSALELCLRDHRARLVEVVMAALAPAMEGRLERRVHDALQSASQRSRASAFELIAAAPGSRLIPGATALLRYLLFEDGAGRPAGPDAGGPEHLLHEAMASVCPWVRRAAALLAGPAAAPAAGYLPAAAGAAKPNRQGDRAMALDDQELERIIALKRTPLFRYVPFETVAEIARAGQPRSYLPGEEVTADAAGRQDLLILEAGVLAVDGQGGAALLAAPACLGEAALVGEPMPWPRITAVEDSRIWFLHAALFQDLCHEHPEMAIELCKLLARRMREANGSAPAPG